MQIENDNIQENKPVWRKDFPIRRQDALQISRREFAKFLCLVSGGLALGNLWVLWKAWRVRQNSSPPVEQEICSVTEVPLGGTKSFMLGDIPYILIRTIDNQWYAYEQKCTHLSCAVFYNPQLDKIECPCHKGFFDVKTGAVLQGPPPRPLPKLAVKLSADKVIVIHSESSV